MTQTTEDPFAAAQATINQNAPAPIAPAPIAPVQQAAQPSPLDGGYGDATGSSLLFETRGATASLFNKTHLLGSERSGIITATKDVQDQDFNAKLPKFFSTSRVGGERGDKAVTTDAIDGPTGTPNRPVMVTHISLDTVYRLTLPEAMAVNGGDQAKATSRVAEDDGKRVEVVGGFDFKPFMDAMIEARSRGIALNNAGDLVGKRLTVKRSGQKPNPGGNPSWIKTYRIDNA